MPELMEEIPARALAVYAHPDDPDVGCGGTLAAWSAKGCEVHVLLCTDGDKGATDPSAEPAELASRRAVEAAGSASLIGLAGQESLHYPDGELRDTLGLQRALVAVVRRLRPDVVLCPDPTAVFFGQDYFNHRDHRVTGWAVLDAVAPAAALPLYFPDAGPAHQVSTVLLSGTLEPDVWVDISPTVEVKVRAVACHRSQFPDGAEWATAAVHGAAEDAGRSAGVPYAEGFRRLRLGG
ncbi:MAG TPA: PIG-L deacetylase family protein [Acidimicrobiales bacterium]|jgi:LmbE family N-acetylglucosaminyl deacetylase|nr:PIG-L deacetylase family protein [Acidimicrobiales bacterium]